MSYPKNDAAHHTFVIGRVEDGGGSWLLFNQRHRHTINCEKMAAHPPPKPGWLCRVYEGHGTHRGCYIAGRKMFYASADEQCRQIRAAYTKSGLNVIR